MVEMLCKLFLTGNSRGTVNTSPVTANSCITS